MSLQDLMSDFVARINNAVLAGNPQVRVMKNGLVSAVSKKLTTLGYFQGFEEDGFNLVVTLTPNKIKKIKRISKPGKRVYTGAEEITRILGGIGYTLVSTSQGVLTHVEARKGKTGGEVLLQII
jgi:small subunit ribosomal protein S8